MAQLPPTISYELAEDDLSDYGESTAEYCQETLTSGDRAGEVCGEEKPCRWHDN